MSAVSPDEDERTRFEKWFVFAHGAKPVGDLKKIQEEITDLQEIETRIQQWNLQHAAALAAWAERHGRSTL